MYRRSYLIWSPVIGSFALDGLLLDKPWSLGSSVLPPDTCLHFLSRLVQQSHHCSSIFIECKLTHASRFPLINFYARKSPYEYMHSVRLDPTKLILEGTRTTPTNMTNQCDIPPALVWFRDIRSSPTFFFSFRCTNKNVRTAFPYTVVEIRVE